MPRYDYDCAACGRRFEVMYGVHADPPTSCPLCGSGPVRKAISAPAIHFKGSGWAKKERHASAKSGSSSKSTDDGSSDTGSKDGGATVSEPAAAKSGSSSDGGSSTATKPTTKTPAAAAD